MAGSQRIPERTEPARYAVMKVRDRGMPKFPGQIFQTLLAGTIWLSACDVQVSQEEKLVYHYSEGIQSRHELTYGSVYLACHPSEEGKRLASRLSAYEEMRRKGSLVFSADGIELIKITALGRGTFFKVHDRSLTGSHLQFRTLVKPEYASINYTDFPRGAVIYVLGEPFGSVVALPIGDVQGPRRRVVAAVETEWRWEKRPKSPMGWCLVSITPLSGAATYQTLQFREVASSAPSASP